MEGGWKVINVSDRRGEDCVSGGAGAVWEYPPFQIKPVDKAKKWALASLSAFDKMAADGQSSGVVYRKTRYVYDSDVCVVPRGADEVKGFEYFNAQAEMDGGPPLAESARTTKPNEPIIKPMGGRSGYAYTVPIIHMKTYLPWLRARCEANGVKFMKLTVTDLLNPAPNITADLVVNCTGLRAEKLTTDNTLRPIRGGLVMVRAPWITEMVSDESCNSPNLCYLIPQRDGIVALAGLSQIGKTRDEGNTTSDLTDTRVLDGDEVKGIIDRCTLLLPGLQGAEVVGSWAGSRPGRDEGARVELVETKGKNKKVPRIIHNYGHGGSGVIASWGCAEEVAMLAAKLSDNLSPRVIPFFPTVTPSATAPKAKL